MKRDQHRLNVKLNDPSSRLMPVEKLNERAGSEGDAISCFFGKGAEENWNTPLDDGLDSYFEMNIGEDDEIDEGNLVMKAGGVDGGVLSPSGDDEVESLDANETSEGVRGRIERQRADGDIG